MPETEHQSAECKTNANCSALEKPLLLRLEVIFCPSPGWGSLQRGTPGTRALPRTPGWGPCRGSHSGCTLWVRSTAGRPGCDQRWPPPGRRLRRWRWWKVGLQPNPMRSLGGGRAQTGSEVLSQTSVGGLVVWDTEGPLWAVQISGLNICMGEWERAPEQGEGQEAWAPFSPGFQLPNLCPNPPPPRSRCGAKISHLKHPLSPGIQDIYSYLDRRRRHLGTEGRGTLGGGSFQVGGTPSPWSQQGDSETRAEGMSEREKDRESDRERHREGDRETERA